jgi:hypothetical protein
MAETAAHLVDHVFPPLPVRQWVLSVPKRLRYFLEREPAAASAVLHILLRVVEAHLRGRSPGASAQARFGAVSFVHRFGAALNRHLHYHCCILDGVFEPLEAAGVQFRNGGDARQRHRGLSHHRDRGLLTAPHAGHGLRPDPLSQGGSRSVDQGLGTRHGARDRVADPRAIPAVDVEDAVGEALVGAPLARADETRHYGANAH